MAIQFKSATGFDYVSAATPLPVTIVGGGTGDVDGPASATDNAIVRFDGTTGKLIQNSTATLSDNGDIAIPSTATSGVQIFNTVDQATNTEAGVLAWVSNSFRVRAINAGTGTARGLVLQAVNGSTSSTSIALQANGPSGGLGAGFIVFTGASASVSGTDPIFVFTGATNSSSSGTRGYISITPTYNQTGTAGGTDLKITRTQTAVGSGSHYLIQAGTSGSESLFTVNNLGYGTFGGVTPTTTTFLHTAAGTTGVSSLRIPHGSAPTSPVDGDMWTTTAGLFVRINGSTVGPLS